MGVVNQVADELEELCDTAINGELSKGQLQNLAVLGASAAALLRRFQEQEDRQPPLRSRAESEYCYASGVAGICWLPRGHTGSHQFE